MKKNVQKFLFLLTLVLFLLTPGYVSSQEDEAAAEIGTAEQSEITAEEPSAVEAEAAEVSTTEVANNAEPEPVSVVQSVLDGIASFNEEATAPQPPPGGMTIADFSKRFGIVMGIIAIQILLIWLVWLLFKKIAIKVDETAGAKIKPLVIRKFKLLSAKQITDVIQFLLRILKYVVTAIQLFLTVPIVFIQFPATKKLASTIFGYVLNPLKDIGLAFVHYIPNLFWIAIIIIIARYALKALKFLSTQIARGKLVIPGFYDDWAAPTYKILQVLLLAFTIAIIYPYLPGSDSKAFQGVSVFVGIIFSLGSSSAIGNLVAGIVITYMRPFKIGDRVQIKEITGFVVEKNLMVVRIKTHKNEYVTFPNLLILGSNIINYNTSSDEDEEGLIMNTEVTFGYATPWEKVHEILIEAALATEFVQKKPRPFVLQTAMDDFYAHYQINCYTKQVDKVPAIYTALYANIQNGFKEAGIDMTSPHYEIAAIQNESKQSESKEK